MPKPSYRALQIAQIVVALSLAAYIGWRFYGGDEAVDFTFAGLILLIAVSHAAGQAHRAENDPR